MAKRTSKTRTKRAKSEKASGGETGGLGGLSMVELQAELNRRQRAAGSLLKRRDRLLRDLDEVNMQIAKSGNAGGGKNGRRMRARNANSLVETILQVLNGRTMGVNEIADAVQKSGYISTSPAFRTIVNQTLINHASKFKRVSRGQYAAK